MRTPLGVLTAFSGRPLLWLFAALLGAFGPVASASSVFYQLKVAASTDGTNFTGFGIGPSINGKGKVAFVAQYANGQSLGVWSPASGLTDIASNFLSSNRSFGDSAQINDNDEVIAWDRITGATPIGEVRVFRSATPNDSTVMVRGLPGFFANGYDTLFQYPTINNSQVLEDDSQNGNRNGVCDAGEACVSQVAFGAFRAANASRTLSTVTANPIAGSDFGTFREFALNTSVARPWMADDGSVVIRGNLPSNPILLFNYHLDAPKQIAGAADGFTTLGAAPSVTSDGKIVAFAGDRGKGNGVFLSIEYAPGKRRLVRIVGENAAVQKAELGYDANLNKLYFSSIELDSRVAVIYTPDNNGLVNGSVVVSFIGTPNAASRTNAGTGRPWTFTSQKGIFTIRIDVTAKMFEDDVGNLVCVASVPGAAGQFPVAVGDDSPVPDGNGGTSFISAGANKICETPNDDRTDTLFTRSSPIPVVQIGDKIYDGAKSYVVSALSVNVPLAQANADSQGDPRIARIGDHRVVFWAQAGATQLIVSGEHLDSDQDGLMDHWELNGIDLTGDGTVDVDLPGMGADPLKRDLFLQIDFGLDRPAPLNEGARHTPAPQALRELSDFYAAAPATFNGIAAGITLHVDAGSDANVDGNPFSRSMYSGELLGGNTIAGPGNKPIDVLYKGLPGSVNIPNVTALDFDSVKTAHFWNRERGGREFAFMYIVYADFHHALDLTGNDNNAHPFVGNVTTGHSNAIDDTSVSAGFPGLRGNGVIITSGTGAGQLRRITSSGKALDANGVALPIGRIVVSPDFAVQPDATSTYVMFDGSTGEGHATERNDGSFGPGKNLAITLGSANTFYSQWADSNNNPYKFVGSPGTEREVMAHEIGHLITLKHGGINHDNYKPLFVSLMNYAYSYCPAGQRGKDANGNQLPNAAACPITDYSGVLDAVFWDYGHMDLKSSLNFESVGIALGKSPDVSPPFPAPRETSTWATIERQFGPADVAPPIVIVTAPANGSSVTAGNGVTVNFSASDNVGVTKARVSFDVNGDGVIDENFEEFAATSLGAGLYTAAIPPISGPNGVRKATVLAFDSAGNPGVAEFTLAVGGVALSSVPNVVGLTQAAATTAISGAGLVLGVVSTAASPTVAAGSVISQNPASGASVAPGSAVNLVVSTGPANVNVPNVVGLTQGAATTAISGAGLVLGVVSTAASPTVAAGSVISQNPASGASVAPGSAVNLVVSTGPANVSVPNVVGLAQGAAATAISGAGLVLGVVSTAASPTVAAGSVISQNPASGASVAPGSAVNLVVSTGSIAVVRCDVDRNGQIDRADISLITAALGQRAIGLNDLRDANADGIISIGDARQCVLACTRANCAVN